MTKNYSVDDDAQVDVKGIYSYLGYGQHSLELEYDTLSLKDNAEIWQDDWVAVYSNYQLANWQLTFGVHHSQFSNQEESSDPETEEQLIDVVEETVITPMLGAHYTRYNYYGYKVWTAGVDLLKTHYENNGNANFVQISPYYGHYFAVGTQGHYLYSKITLHSQFFDEVFLADDRYFNTELAASYVAKNTSYSLSGQWGDNLNQYNLGGFSFSPDNKIYSKNIQFSVSHSFSHQFFMKALLKQQYYSDSPDSSQEYIRSGQLLVGVNF